MQFGDTTSAPAPSGYCLNLVRTILKEKPELKGQLLIDEVNKQKQYECNSESIARYARQMNP